MTIAISHAASVVIAAVAGWALPPSATAQRAPVADTLATATFQAAATLRLGWPIWIGMRL